MRELLVIAHSAAAEDRARVLFGDWHRARRMRAGGSARALMSALRLVLARRGAALYLIDIGSSTTVLALAGRLLGRRVILDTGDLVYALERSRGARSSVGLLLVSIGEKLALRAAHHIVVRGRGHLRHLPRRPATFVPDLAPPGARPVDGRHLRESMGLTDRFVVGFVGTMNVAPRLGTAYGWEIVEALAHLDRSFAAVFVGDGEGRPDLERRAHELGVADRCRFVGPVHGDAVLPYLGAMDVGVSTQTNDVVGEVRTTGKLPLYLACGCPVLASDVGEARRLIAPLGWTVRYDGVVDRAYPGRLAARLREWAGTTSSLAEARAERSRMALEVHAREFDLGAVRRRLEGDLSTLLDG